MDKTELIKEIKEKLWDLEDSLEYGNASADVLFEIEDDLKYIRSALAVPVGEESEQIWVSLDIKLLDKILKRIELVLDRFDPFYREEPESEPDASQEVLKRCHRCESKPELVIKAIPIIASPGYGPDLREGIEGIELVCLSCGFVYAEGQRYTGTGAIVWMTWNDSVNEDY